MTVVEDLADIQHRVGRIVLWPTSGAQYAGSAAGWAPAGGSDGQAQHEQPASCAPAKPASFTVYLPLLRLSLRAMGVGDPLPERLKLGDEKLADLPAGLPIWLSVAQDSRVYLAADPLRLSSLPTHQFSTRRQRVTGTVVRDGSRARRAPSVKQPT